MFPEKLKLHEKPDCSLNSTHAYFPNSGEHLPDGVHMQLLYFSWTYTAWKQFGREVGWVEQENLLNL